MDWEARVWGLVCLALLFLSIGREGSIVWVEIRYGKWDADKDTDCESEGEIGIGGYGLFVYSDVE